MSSFHSCVCLYSVPCQAPAQSKDTEGRGVELKGSSNKKNGGAGGGDSSLGSGEERETANYSIAAKY